MSKRKVRTFSATDRDMDMLEAVATYHSFSKSATIVNLIKKEVLAHFSRRDESRATRYGARIEEEVADGTDS